MSKNIPTRDTSTIRNLEKSTDALRDLAMNCGKLSNSRVSCLSASAKLQIFERN